jgi:hypothetical protein
VPPTWRFVDTYVLAQDTEKRGALRSASLKLTDLADAFGVPQAAQAHRRASARGGGQLGRARGWGAVRLARGGLRPAAAANQGLQRQAGALGQLPPRPRRSPAAVWLRHSPSRHPPRPSLPPHPSAPTPRAGNDVAVNVEVYRHLAARWIEAQGGGGGGLGPLEALGTLVATEASFTGTWFHLVT